MKSAVQFRLIDLILAMTVCLPVRHTLHNSQVHDPGVMRAELGSGFICCWSLLRNNNMVHFKLR